MKTMMAGFYNRKTLTVGLRPGKISDLSDFVVGTSAKSG
jgi:hypothetical protein